MLSMRGQVHPVAIDVFVSEQDVTDINADAEFNLLVATNIRIPSPHFTLDFYRTEDCLFDSAEFNQHSIAHELDGATVMQGDFVVQEFLSMPLEGRQGALLVNLHQSTVTNDVRGHDDGEFLFHRCSLLRSLTT